MATSIKHKGWKLDADRSYLAALFNSTEAFRITASAVTVALPTTVSSTLAVTSTSTFTGAATFVGAVLPSVSNTPALGSATLMWADLFLGSAAVINFNNGNVTITHAAGALACTGALTLSIATATTSATTGALIVTGGIGTSEALWVGTTSRLVGAVTASSTLGIAGKITSTSTTSISFNPTLVPDETRTNYIWSYGTRATAKDLAMAASASYNLDPIQVNLNIIGTAPTSSTVNLSYMKITHAFADMTGLRLKCSDWNISVAKDIQDAYVYQGEIDFTAASIAVGGEAAVLGLVMNAGANAVTGNLRGLIISMQGAGSYSTVVGLEIRTTCGDVLGHGCSEAIRIAGTPLPVVGIAMGNQTNNNEGPQYAFFFPSTGSPDTGPWSATNATGDAGKIAIKIGANTKYINVYTS